MYNLVYDSLENLNFPFLSYMLLALTLVVYFFYLNKRNIYYASCLYTNSNKITKAKCQFIRFFILTFLSLALLVFATQVYTKTKMFLHIKSSIQEKNYSSISGVIENFIPMPYSGHINESFDVHGATFSYSDYSGNNYFFKQTKNHGGPIKNNGQKVKIDYLSFNYTGCLPLIEYFGKECPKLTKNKIIKLWINN